MIINKQHIGGLKQKITIGGAPMSTFTCLSKKLYTLPGKKGSFVGLWGVGWSGMEEGGVTVRGFHIKFGLTQECRLV